MALCLSFCAILQVYHFTLKQPGYDFYNFWIYAQEFRHSDVPNLAPVLLALISPVIIRKQISEMKINVPTQLLTGLLFFIYALLPLRLLVPTASAYDVALTTGLASLTFWALLIFCLYQNLKG